MRLLDNVRMARSMAELNTQARSLKQDVDRMVEEVNEFAKQSISSLLATLLTGQMFLATSLIPYFKRLNKLNH